MRWLLIIFLLLVVVDYDSRIRSLEYKVAGLSRR